MLRAISRSLLLIVITLPLRAEGDGPAPEKAPELRIMKTAGGVRFGIWPDLPQQPAPTLFVFSGTIEGTLGDAYYRQAANTLAKKGYLCVSIDLPCHGLEQRDGEPAGIAGWRHRCEQNQDFVADLTGRLKAVLDHLIENKLTDPHRIAASGTSRGGYAALQFAAADPRVKAVAAFAPVTDLAVLTEFRGAEQNALVQRSSLEQRAGDIAGRGVWLVMGDRDERVGTDQMIRFARKVTTEAIRLKREARVDLHILAEPKGHTTPAGSADLAAEWIEQQLSLGM